MCRADNLGLLVQEDLPVGVVVGQDADHEDLILTRQSENCLDDFGDVLNLFVCRDDDEFLFQISQA